MSDRNTPLSKFIYSDKFPFEVAFKFIISKGGFLSVCFFSILLTLPIYAQQSEKSPPPVIVQPGAPGQATKVLPPSTRATLPPIAPKDVEFMQGMIMHHAQAVEMTALIEARTENKNIRLLGARISQSQSDEMNFMKRWLGNRGQDVSMSKMPGMDMSGHHSSKHHSSGHQMMMPGMLTEEQMEALKNAKGAEFDKLFLKGMIQHHKGALVMVNDLFDTAGAGQDAELFNFATDVDSGQTAEIKIMQNMLGEKP
ncbi:MAG: DUF305 domain-containing protein [Pyrinomonadaceae bacterium]|nr:DUF305 domain-containing protein [Pyrinomonadaceae bacterium]